MTKLTTNNEEMTFSTSQVK